MIRAGQELPSCVALMVLVWLQSTSFGQATPRVSPAEPLVIDGLRALTADADAIDILAISNIPDWQGFEAAQVGNDTRLTAIAREEILDRQNVEEFKERWIAVNFHLEGAPADPARRVHLPEYLIRFRRAETILLEINIALKAGELHVSKRDGLAYFDPRSAPATSLTKAITTLLSHPAIRVRKLFWLDSGKPCRANLDGSGVESLGGEFQARYMTLSSCGRYIFYAVGVSGSTIYRSDRDGKNWKQLLTLAAAGDKMQVRGMTVNPRDQRLYWISSPRYKGDRPVFVESCLYDGSRHVRMEVVSEGMPRGIAVDPKANQVYWAAASEIAADKILRLTLPLQREAASAVEPLAWEGKMRPGLPRWLAIDPRDERLIWVDENPKCLMRSDLDGRNCLPVASGLVHQYSSLAIDAAKHQIYWLHSDDGEIWRCDYDGGAPTKVMSTEISPRSLCIDSSFPSTP